MHHSWGTQLCCVADQPIRLGILLPLSGSWDIGSQIAGVAALAVEQVNADSLLLPGRVLEYSWADSGCSAKMGLRAIAKLMSQSEIDAVIGLYIL